VDFPALAGRPRVVAAGRPRATTLPGSARPDARPG